MLLESRTCISRVFVVVGCLAMVSCQMFDKRPTVYDHMKSGANTVKTNLIDTQLKWETEYLPNDCTPVDEDNFFEDREVEIAFHKEKLRLISVEEGDTVTMDFTVMLDSDGTIIDTSRDNHPDDDIDDVNSDADNDTDNDTVGDADGSSEDEEDSDKTEKEEPNSNGEEKSGPSPPATFTVGYGMIIPGWDMAVRGMCLGERRRIIVPPQLAYGAKGYKPKKIPADATLEIEAELIHLKKKNSWDYYMDFLHNLHLYAFFILGLTFLLSGYYKSKIANKRRLYREIMEKKKKEKEE